MRPRSNPRRSSGAGAAAIDTGCGFARHRGFGVENAAYYSTAPLRDTLAGPVHLAGIRSRRTRLTVGRDDDLTLDHVVTSGALPSAFPAVRIDGDPCWDGIDSITPIEAVLDDRPRRDSVIFTVRM